jgi:hypothetical protein
MNIKLNNTIAAFGAALLLTAASYAKTAPACQTGKLLDVQEDIEFVPTTQIGQAQQSKKGKNWTMITLPSTRKQTTYIVKVQLGGIIYTARSSGDFWGYNPSSMVVNSDVEACVDSNKLVLTRPDGKQYKPTIIRRERDQSAPSGK